MALEAAHNLPDGRTVVRDTDTDEEVVLKPGQWAGLSLLEGEDATARLAELVEENGPEWAEANKDLLSGEPTADDGDSEAGA